MKQTVIILSGSDNSNSVYKGRMRELQNMTLKELATEFFPTDTFDVVIFDGLNYNDNIELKKLLKSDDKRVLQNYPSKLKQKPQLSQAEAFLCP